MNPAVPPLFPPRLPTNAALLLDFDGTLVPFAPRPQDVYVPEALIDLLRALAATLKGALAIVSGRSIADLDGLLRPLMLPAAGLHGAELRLPGRPVEHHHAVPPAVVRASAEALVASHAGLLLEDKGSGMALHFRARPELGALCSDTLHAALNGTGADVSAQWQLMPGHAVIELKQRRVSKGSALQALMREPPFIGRVPVYVGDDVTDEDGIIAAQAAGGVGIRVGTGASAARHRLADPVAVTHWLAGALQEAGR